MVGAPPGAVVTVTPSKVPMSPAAQHSKPGKDRGDQMVHKVKNGRAGGRSPVLSKRKLGNVTKCVCLCLPP